MIWWKEIAVNMHTHWDCCIITLFNYCCDWLISLFQKRNHVDNNEQHFVQQFVSVSMRHNGIVFVIFELLPNHSIHIRRRGSLVARKLMENPAKFHVMIYRVYIVNVNMTLRLIFLFNWNPRWKSISSIIWISHYMDQNCRFPTKRDNGVNEHVKFLQILLFSTDFVCWNFFQCFCQYNAIAAISVRKTYFRIMIAAGAAFICSLNWNYIQFQHDIIHSLLFAIEYGKLLAARVNIEINYTIHINKP